MKIIYNNQKSRYNLSFYGYENMSLKNSSEYDLDFSRLPRKIL